MANSSSCTMITITVLAFSPRWMPIISSPFRDHVMIFSCFFIFFFLEVTIDEMPRFLTLVDPGLSLWSYRQPCLLTGMASYHIASEVAAWVGSSQRVAIRRTIPELLSTITNEQIFKIKQIETILRGCILVYSPEKMRPSIRFFDIEVNLPAISFDIGCFVGWHQFP